jgi:hypothetical protein
VRARKKRPLAGATVLTFILPCRVIVGKKEVPLNLNWYRNAHYRILAEAKRNFAPISTPDRFEQMAACEIHYTLNLPTKRRTDGQNWLAVVDKFFADWLVDKGIIADDCAKVYQGGCWSVSYDSSTGMQIIAKIIKKTIDN